VTFEIRVRQLDLQSAQLFGEDAPGATDRAVEEVGGYDGVQPVGESWARRRIEDPPGMPGPGSTQALLSTRLTRPNPSEAPPEQSWRAHLRRSRRHRARSAAAATCPADAARLGPLLDIAEKACPTGTTSTLVAVRPRLTRLIEPPAGRASHWDDCCCSGWARCWRGRRRRAELGYLVRSSKSTHPRIISVNACATSEGLRGVPVGHLTYVARHGSQDVPPDGRRRDVI
jgi:hypothetical protein